MKKGMTRRRFISNSVAAGAAATVGGGFLGEFISPVVAEEAGLAGLAAVTGPDGFANTIAAVKAVGGMARFVPEGSKVIINANTAFKHRGSIVDPGVLLAILKLCSDAGAEEMWLVKGTKDDFWKRCERASDHANLIDGIKVSERKFDVVQIANGVALKEAHIDRHLLSADVYLDVTVAKHHKGCEFTGALKNTMGACPHDPTCRFFHVGTNPDSEAWYPDLDHLSQCVADLNLVRQPDLCILDAGEILTTNGPFGPGKLANPQAVVASADMVAIDAYGVRYLGLKPEAIPAIAKAEAHGLGTADLAKVGVKEIVIG
jgi:uncharacterized protein (DUF362 family)